MGLSLTMRSAVNKLPPEVHAELVETLFGTTGSFVSGMFGGLVASALAWIRTGDVIFAICTAITITLIVFRVVVFVAHHRASVASRVANAPGWEAAYAVGGIGFMATVGITGAVLLDGHYDEIISLYGIVIVLGCAGSVAGRNAGRPVIVIGQILGLCVPVATVLLLRGDYWYWGLSFILFLIFTSVKSTTQFLNKMLVSALVSDRESRLRGLQLGIALDSMTHGLCMAARTGAITVLNHRLRDTFNLSQGPGPESLDSLARAIAAAGSMSPVETEAFARAFHDHCDGREPRHWSATVGNRTFVFRSQPMSDGGAVVVVEDVTEARRSAQKVEYLAHFDALTGLANRFYFHQELGAAIRDLEPEHGITLLGVDLDRFKEVNDTLGHAAGDSLLRQVADRLQAFGSSSVTVGRFGGDEFHLLLAPSPEIKAAEAFAQKVIGRISEPYIIDGQSVSIGASIGIAQAPEDACEVDDLLRCADMAMYGAKSLARGTWLRFVPEMDVQVQRRRQIELELRDALEAGQIEVFYQPTVDLRTGRVASFEALVRWRHPIRGLISPESFIPVAEECGLIADLGEFVMRRACEDAAQWPAEIRVAVNVSPKQFLLRRDLVERIATILSVTGLPAQRLEIEITESTLLEAKAALATLAASGIRISLDDFGTGYSSLSYLRLFEIHKIKIDRSFVSIGDPASLAIIEAVASLATALHLDVVVEGVETQQQLEAMADRGILLIQGYIFSKPRPLIELMDLIHGSLDHIAKTLKAVA